MPIPMVTPLTAQVRPFCSQAPRRDGIPQESTGGYSATQAGICS
ncbi:hypothetical protein [Acaryochloris marina]|nr:hypothetical protein [Acaryochloris marina]